MNDQAKNEMGSSAVPTAKPAESQADGLGHDLAIVQLAVTYYVEAKWRDRKKGDRASEAWERICSAFSTPEPKPGAGDTAEGPTPDPVFDERHDSECNWRVKREMCDCWLKDEEADDNMATDRAAWPGSTDGGKA